MAKSIHKLTALAVTKATKPGHLSDGGGLFLQVTASGAKSWVFRFTSPVTGKPREMGLGPLDTFGLSSARERAGQARQSVHEGRDPIVERDAAKSRARVEAAKDLTFSECAKLYIKAKSPDWKNTKHVNQWVSTLETYAEPKLGKLPVSAVDTGLVLQVLEPIWLTKNETASRLRGRIEAVLDWATSREYRTGENPARWKGHLQHQLATPSKVQGERHFPALDYVEIGAFLAALRQREGMAAKAIEFCMLTATRSGEVRGAKWNEFDLANKLWTIPPARMKAGREHTVPLSDQVIRLLESLPRTASDYVFFSPGGSMLSDMTLTATLRRLHAEKLKADGLGWVDRKQGEPGKEPRTVTVHGFRSTFRVWGGERTAYPHEVLEKALAHNLTDKVVAAYMRGNLLDKRIRLMQDWADFCDKADSPATVIPIRTA
ncbi:MAG: tyrosine-type recombinase/integrase [Limnobacter sp.]|nr:tyrosine-type recombinase/integrase [Limnobacter sp.]